MYKLKKRIEIAGSHCLKLDYKSKCQNLHGHNWIIDIYLEGKVLDKNGMLCDFTKIKEIVHLLDHKNLNDIVDFNPTAENIAKYIHDLIENNTYEWVICRKVVVTESEGNIASYEI